MSRTSSTRVNDKHFSITTADRRSAASRASRTSMPRGPPSAFQDREDQEKFKKHLQVQVSTLFCYGSWSPTSERI